MTYLGKIPLTNNTVIRDKMGCIVAVMVRPASLKVS